ncbi:putative transcription elongation factor SPT5 homolog 1 [Drosera capensis]
MARDRDDDDMPIEEEEDYGEEEEEEEEDFEHRDKVGKRRRSEFIEDAAEEADEDEEEEEEEEEEEDYGRSKRNAKRGRIQNFLDDEAVVDSDEEEEVDEEEEDNEMDIPDDDDVRRMHRRPILPREEEDVEELEKKVHERYARSSRIEYDEETTDVEQQALLPSIKDPKLWMVKCSIGMEREIASSLLQKFVDKPELQIRSAIALDHLKNYIYIEADKEAHVREAIKGLNRIYGSKVLLVPIKEMTDVLSVESKTLDLAMGSWVRMKSGTHKGDLAQVAKVDDVQQKVTIKLIPRVDLQALANKLEGHEAAKKKTFVPPPKMMNLEEAREMRIPIYRKKDKAGEYYDFIETMKFKDGFLWKDVSMKSIRTINIQPTFDELEKFQQSGDGDGDLGGLTALFANRKKGHFMKGDAVIIVKGDLKNLKGWVEKVEDGYVHIRPNEKGLPRTLAINEKELCKYFEPGNHVKVVSGSHEGVTGMVIMVEGHVLIILSDTTKEHLRVFADHVVESSEVTTGIIGIGDYELHDLVLLDDSNFGVIIRVESEAFQILKGSPDRAEVIPVRLREIRSKIDKKLVAQDRSKNTISVKDVVRILEGPSKGKQGPVEHIYKGVLFIYDRHHLEHAGFICARSQGCLLVGGSFNGRDRTENALSYLRTPQRLPQSPGRLPPRGPSLESGGRLRPGGRGHDSLIGTTVKIRLGPYKGYRGRVKDVKGTSVRIEDGPRYGMGSETPMHPSRTPMHPFTPIRETGASTPVHDGMRTPRRDRAWNPNTPMTPARENWDDANPASWLTNSQYRPGSPVSRPYEAATPRTGWAGTPGGGYSDAATPKDNGSAYSNAPSPYSASSPGQPMTPSSAAYSPGTPGGQPMTPGGTGLDMMSPATGGENEVIYFLPDILVNVHKPGEDAVVGVVQDVLPDSSCRVLLGLNGGGEIVTALPNEIEVIPPRKSDKIKIMGGGQRGATGRLIGIDGTDGIVKVDVTLDVKILNLVFLAKLAH